jgi:tripartite-type tricarboxylate transporter receptor subunit TctC
VVPFSAGGANDLMARSAAEGASKILGQPVVIDNRPGAGGTVGADIVAKAQPDGYTLLVSAAGVISNSMIKKTMPFKDDACSRGDDRPGTFGDRGAQERAL